METIDFNLEYETKSVAFQRMAEKREVGNPENLFAKGTTLL